MRLEFYLSVFLSCVLLSLVVCLLSRRHRSKPYFVFILSFCGALLLPALIPGHGEFIIVLPNVALFAVTNSLAWGIGLFYLLINFFISYMIINSLYRYFK